MRVIVTTEAHFTRDPSGVIRSDTGGRSYGFWARYLEVFDSVGILARVSDLPHSSGVEVMGPKVTVIEIPGYSGLMGTLKALPRTRKVVRKAALQRDTVYISRVPSLIGDLLITALRRSGKPYAVEVVGDPYDVFSSGVTRSLLDRGLRSYFTRSLRRTVREACAVAYVTSSTLQRKYPSAPGSVTSYFSSVHLPNDAFSVEPAAVEPDGRVIVAVGTHSQMYKGHDLLIDAAGRLQTAGRPIVVRLVGDGRFHEDLKRLAFERGVADSVEFAGSLPAGPAVREILDTADLFVMPSRTEGLPRALIEAMARGLPCIGTEVGAIPELLEPTELIESDNVEALASAIDRMLADRERRQRLASVNLGKASDYHEAVLSERRRHFYSAVRDLSMNQS